MAFARGRSLVPLARCCASGGDDCGRPGRASKPVRVAFPLLACSRRWSRRLGCWGGCRLGDRHHGRGSRGLRRRGRGRSLGRRGWSLGRWRRSLGRRSRSLRHWDRRRGGSGLGGRRGHGRRRRLTGGKERERVEVPGRVGRDPDAEVDVWDRVLALAARADRADRRPLVENRVAVDGDRAEVDERDGVAVRRLHGHRSAAAWDGAGEAHDSGGRRSRRRPLLSGDVDASMLPSGVGIVPEFEWS